LRASKWSIEGCSVDSHDRRKGSWSHGVLMGFVDGTRCDQRQESGVRSMKAFTAEAIRSHYVYATQ
jgi:hypothetical protein